MGRTAGVIGRQCSPLVLWRFRILAFLLATQAAAGSIECYHRFCQGMDTAEADTGGNGLVPFADVLSVAAGRKRTCAVKSDGTA